MFVFGSVCKVIDKHELEHHSPKWFGKQLLHDFVFWVYKTWSMDVSFVAWPTLSIYEKPATVLKTIPTVCPTVRLAHIKFLAPYPMTQVLPLDESMISTEQSLNTALWRCQLVLLKDVSYVSNEGPLESLKCMIQWVLRCVEGAHFFWDAPMCFFFTISCNIDEFLVPRMQSSFVSHSSFELMTIDWLFQSHVVSSLLHWSFVFLGSMTNQ